MVAFVPGVGVRPFHFATVFDKHSQQEHLYNTFARGAVLCALNGVNACVLAYGQTGSGKTFSLFGPPGWLTELQHGGAGGGVKACHGIVVRAVSELLEAAAKMRREGTALVSVSAQYVQVYREGVICLRSGDKVTLRSGGATGSFVLAGAVEAPVASEDDLLGLLEHGEEHKRYGATAMNDRSSRAHSVLVLNLSHVRPSGAEGGVGMEGGALVKSQLLLADLAGVLPSDKIRPSH